MILRADTHPDPRALVGRLLNDAEIEPGALTISRADVERVAAGAFEFALSALAAELAQEAYCRICGCTQLRACPGGCSWVEPDLCSACSPFVEGR